MTTEEILEYYADTVNRKIREDLVFAVNLVGGNPLCNNNKVAIDCGCGAGSDIAYLRKEGFIVYAFDIEEESMKICRERFTGDKDVLLSRDSFSSFDYPKPSLIVADASLFFCPEKEFAQVWNKIYNSLNVGGIFCGSFLGPQDSMASPGYDEGAYWSGILVFDETDLRSRLEEFDVLKFTEHNLMGETQQGKPHQWHIFSVVAKKA